MKRVPTRTPSAPAASAAATPRAVAIPPAAITGIDTASSTASSSGSSVGPSMRLRPPDSHALAITTSQPAASAARASSPDSTCQPQTAPPAWTRLDQRRVGIGEEEVDVRRALGRELERVRGPSAAR